MNNKKVNTIIIYSVLAILFILFWVFVIYFACTNTDDTVESKYLCRVDYCATDGGNIKTWGDPRKKDFQTVPYGGDINDVTAIPDEGYYFVKWSDGVTDFKRSDKEIKDNFEVTAEFAEITDPVTVVYSTKGNGGITGRTKQTVQRGTHAQPVEASAYKTVKEVFIGWSDGVPEPIRQDLTVNESMEVTALFGYTVYYGVQGMGYIFGEQKQFILHGEYYAQTVTAVPRDGYRFVKWSDGVKTATRRDKCVTESIAVYAVFELYNTDYFTYNYNYATGNYSQDNLILKRGATGGVRAVIPQREFFTFNG